MAVVVDVQIGHVINEQMIVNAFVHLTPAKIHLRHNGQILRTINTNYNKEAVDKVYQGTFKKRSSVAERKKLLENFNNVLPEIMQNLVLHKSGAKWRGTVNFAATLEKAGYSTAAIYKNALKNALVVSRGQR